MKKSRRYQWDLPLEKNVTLKSWWYKIHLCLAHNTFVDLKKKNISSNELRLAVQNRRFARKENNPAPREHLQNALWASFFVKAAVAVNNTNPFQTETLDVKSALGRTYSLVKCTPPFRPLSNTPLPLPPARIWAFSTISLASARNTRDKKEEKGSEKERWSTGGVWSAPWMTSRVFTEQAKDRSWSYTTTVIHLHTRWQQYKIG